MNKIKVLVDSDTSNIENILQTKLDDFIKSNPNIEIISITNSIITNNYLNYSKIITYILYKENKKNTNQINS